MSIPKSTLENWSGQGATVTPKQLREKIEGKLTGSNSKIKNKYNLDIYLQGSYRNNTNIYGNSDVDIVVQHNSTFFSDTTKLNSIEKSLYEKAFSGATYTWDTFKAELIETLEDAFGIANIEVGNKSIKVDNGNYEADVVPCFEYRKYLKFGLAKDEREYIPGIKFYTTNEKRTVINFPKEHRTNGASKNQRVNEYYKPTIRIFKNMKKKLIEKGKIDSSNAPSYFIENLLYNVPDKIFNEVRVERRILNILKWFYENKSSLSSFICQNEQTKLFGNSEEQWNEVAAKEFINQIILQWNEWN